METTVLFFSPPSTAEQFARLVPPIRRYSPLFQNVNQRCVDHCMSTISLFAECRVCDRLNLAGFRNSTFQIKYKSSIGQHNTFMCFITTLWMGFEFMSTFQLTVVSLREHRSSFLWTPISSEPELSTSRNWQSDEPKLQCGGMNDVLNSARNWQRHFVLAGSL